ncbi:fibroblast growth factor 5-like isoform X2 [Conger conger]|uniref:fibroblast growth factor 5-like isoform X2 n=1 Tax=Conger conger TaxID=82655 RepID=UPI002A5ABB0D|nr:fibroblast growth factor 5-like isoform X2 [Conger conger]
MLREEEFTDDCKFRERFQDSSYNTYSSLMHRNHRSGREWFVALNKRGKAKMGSSPRVKSQHASTHFLPRFNLPERSQWGFTIMDKSKESQNPPQPVPPKATPPAVKHTQPVKYWPKFRFG